MTNCKIIQSNNGNLLFVYLLLFHNKLPNLHNFSYTLLSSAAYHLVEIVGFEPMTFRMQFTRSQLRYTVSYFLSLPNAYISGISLIINYVSLGIAKKAGLKITFFNPIFSSFFTHKPLHLVFMTFDYFSLPLYVIIITAST